jgi:hypothetical protein
MSKFALPLALLLGMAACADRGPTTAATAAAGSHEDQSLQTVSGAVAAALAQPQVRADVRDAMRASLLVEHRVAFRAFLQSNKGASLLSAMAAAMGTDGAGVLRTVAHLPELDFYVADREDRRTWTATENVTVAAALRLPENRMVQRFTPAGAAESAAFGARDPRVVTFHITPAGDRFRRIDPQAARPGAVIEDASDGTYGGRFTWTPTGGKSVVLELADMAGVARTGTARFMVMPSCDPETAIQSCDEGGGGGGGYTVPADTTRLDYFYIHYGDGAGCGDPDPSFIAKHYDAAGNMTGEGRVDYSEYPRHDAIYPRVPLVFRRIREGTGERINLRIVDRDSWFCGGDDDKGNRNYYASENGVTATIFEGSNPTMNAALGWTVKY